MPSTRRSTMNNGTTKPLKILQNFKAKRCQTKSPSGQCETFFKAPDGTIRTIKIDLPNTPLKQAVVSSSISDTETHHIGCQNDKVLVCDPGQEFMKMRNGNLLVFKVPESKETQPKIQPAQQKIHIVRGKDNKLIVSGLHPNQRLIKLPNGKLHVLKISPEPVTTDNKPVLQQSVVNSSLQLALNVVQPDQKVSPDPLTESQLLEAISYLIRTDSNFVKKLHEAYLKSFAEKASV